MRAKDEVRQVVVGTDVGDANQPETATRPHRRQRLVAAKATGRAKSRATTVHHAERRRKTATRPAAKREQVVEAERSEKEPESISRKELLEKALRIIANDLEKDGEKRPTNTITSLVQLLKLDRAFGADEEQPNEIRVVWQEKRNKISNDSAEKSPEDLLET